jgi:hypothetical protein
MTRPHDFVQILLQPVDRIARDVGWSWRATRWIRIHRCCYSQHSDATQWPGRQRLVSRDRLSVCLGMEKITGLLVCLSVYFPLRRTHLSQRWIRCSRFFTWLSRLMHLGTASTFSPSNTELRFKFLPQRKHHKGQRWILTTQLLQCTLDGKPRAAL